MNICSAIIKRGSKWLSLLVLLLVLPSFWGQGRRVKAESLIFDYELNRNPRYDSAYKRTELTYARRGSSEALGTQHGNSGRQFYRLGEQVIDVFCIEPTVAVRNTAEYEVMTLEEALNNAYYEYKDMAKRNAQAIPQIIFYGYTYLPVAERSLDDYFATRFMIWEALGYARNSGNAAVQFPQQWYLDAIAASAERRQIWAQEVSFSNESIELHLGEKKLLSDTTGALQMFMKANRMVAQQDLHLSDSIAVRWDGLNSLELELVGHLSSPETMSLQSKRSNMPLAYFFANSQSVVSSLVPIPYKEINFVVSERVEPKGFLVIKKSGESLSSFLPQLSELNENQYKAVWQPEPLANCTFAVYAGQQLESGGHSWQEGELFCTVQSNADGYTSLIELPAGRYTVRETACPQPYLLSSEEKEIVILPSADTSAAPQELTWENKRKKPVLRIVKEFESHPYQALDPSEISALRFAIYNGDKIQAGAAVLEVGSLLGVYSLTPQADNSAKWAFEAELPQSGKYIVVEHNSPSAYLSQQCEVLVEDTPSNLVAGDSERLLTEFTITNKLRRGQIVLYKYYVEQGVKLPLAGAKFELAVENNGHLQAVQELTSDADGKIICSNLPYATYVIKETLPPQGFALAEQKQTFVVNEQMQEHYFEWENVRNVVFTNPSESNATQPTLPQERETTLQTSISSSSNPSSTPSKTNYTIFFKPSPLVYFTTPSSKRIVTPIPVTGESLQLTAPILLLTAMLSLYFIHKVQK